MAKVSFKQACRNLRPAMPTIIAMKGHPFTQKTELATVIASSFSCPILSLEHFLDILQPSNTSSSLQPQDLAFQIICRITKHHFHKNVCSRLVIDSPLSSSSHLHQLTELASSISPSPRIVVIECKPKNTYLWKLNFERHLVDHPEWTSSWYKPKSWEDVEKAIKLNDHDDMSVTSHKLVSKLIVDPLSDHPIDDRSPHLEKVHRILDAVNYMIKCQGNGLDVVIFHEWKQSRYLDRTSNPYNIKDSDDDSVESFEWLCQDHGHNISYETVVEGPEYKEANCMACEKQVTRSEAIYTCKNCSLALHKECAESFDNDNTWGSPFPASLRDAQYKFPEHFPCATCKEEDDSYINPKCALCLFKTHLKCRLMPTVINHVDTEEHLLTILLPPALNCEAHRCIVCGGSDRYNLYLCKICGVPYHYKCVTFPRRIEHEHGGHNHHLSMKFSSPKEEDYICDECQEWRDPGLWFYSCEECAYEVHLSCIHRTSFVTPESEEIS